MSVWGHPVQLKHWRRGRGNQERELSISRFQLEASSKENRAADTFSLVLVTVLFLES